jgi:hypothetical protein
MVELKRFEMLCFCRSANVLQCLVDIYKSRERGREDVSINTGISEKRKSLALSGDKM